MKNYSNKKYTKHCFNHEWTLHIFFQVQMFDEYSEIMTNYIYYEKYSKISQPHFLDHSVTLPSSQAQALQCRLRRWRSREV